MARTHFWHFLQNEEGQPINEAEISVYLANSSTPAYVYLAESGGTATNVTPQVTTRSDGYFEFWIADALEEYGYTGQKFKIAWSKPGVIDDGYVDYVEISLSVAEVDEYDTDVTKNKTVSNALAKSWNERSKILVTHVIADEWTFLGGNYFVNIVHNFNNEWPLVQCWDVATKQTVEVIAEALTSNAIKIWKIDNNESYITLVG
ncbi:MAG TPA: hypothetical protein P5293_00285 [Bacteroidales bacterium]|nr:hypothetical protein [Bacteroidales bacterium]